MSLQSFEHIRVSSHIEQVLNANSWEQQMRAIMLAGKSLPVLDPELRTGEKQVSGCESKVWLDCQFADEGLKVKAWSDSKVVRGLLALVIMPLQNQSVASVTEFELEGYLSWLGIGRHLSQSRGNGLNALIQAIKSTN